ncbi:uncharacterized protein LY79DRAFT_594003 [Colletotrichum navitas]|uniref:Uncharacterized protein n=1 Tax=Colletotrichum navitas TaxID=681940 RepID=A0AAD8PNA1_9PEZI|nr:uncharacterized protein LY79DRAFT_594003 [Colletotrichum navitas]KAK1573316.1 hypothetical protein LY79DRAFT_594003 [Colletotrichum navitas]
MNDLVDKPRHHPPFSCRRSLRRTQWLASSLDSLLGQDTHFHPMGTWITSPSLKRMAFQTYNCRTSTQGSGSTDVYVKNPPHPQQISQRAQGVQASSPNNETADHHCSFLEFLLASASTSAPSTAAVDGHCPAGSGSGGGNSIPAAAGP